MATVIFLIANRKLEIRCYKSPGKKINFFFLRKEEHETKQKKWDFFYKCVSLLKQESFLFWVEIATAVHANCSNIPRTSHQKCKLEKT